jgi:putative spermidine/putrescine transport system permease protein
MLQSISTFLYRRPGLVLWLMLGPPLAYMLIVYLGSLFNLLIQSFYYLEEFTGLMVREFTLRTYAQIFEPANRDIFVRTAPWRPQ